MKTLISNPPYNMKWQHPIFAQIQERFNKTTLPPESNANYAFILTAINDSDKASMILPLGVLSTTQKEELTVKKYLINNNLIESIILCPDKMFESTSIPVCIITFNKHKGTTLVDMINMSNQYEIENREQKGQYGSKSHTNRTYKKEIKYFNDTHQEMILKILKSHESVENISQAVSIEEIKENDYNIQPTRYISAKNQETKYRTYDEIIKDLNEIIEEKNKAKLIINEQVAKSLGFNDAIKNIQLSNKINEEIINSIKNLNVSKLNITSENYLTISKKKNEISILQNTNNDDLSIILRFALQSWIQHIFFLNTKENIYLAELRDKMLPDLINGVLDLNNINLNKGEEE